MRDLVEEDVAGVGEADGLVEQPQEPVDRAAAFFRRCGRGVADGGVEVGDDLGQLSAAATMGRSTRPSHN